MWVRPDVSGVPPAARQPGHDMTHVAGGAARRGHRKCRSGIRGGGGVGQGRLVVVRGRGARRSVFACLIGMTRGSVRTAGGEVVGGVGMVEMIECCFLPGLRAI